MRFRNRLQQMKGIYPPEVPPADAEVSGRTPGGQTIYKRVVKRRVKKPLGKNGQPLPDDRLLRDEEGAFLAGPGGELVAADPEDHLRRGGNPMTGELGTPRYRWVEHEQVVEHFTITRGKHGNNRITLVDPKQLDAEEARKKSLERQRTLMERVVARAAEVGMDIDAAVDRILGIQRGMERPEDTEPVEDTEPEPVAVAADAGAEDEDWMTEYRREFGGGDEDS